MAADWQTDMDAAPKDIPVDLRALTSGGVEVIGKDYVWRNGQWRQRRGSTVMTKVVGWRARE